MLDAVGFFECRKRRPIHPAGWHRHLQFEGLALIVHGGRAFQRDPVLGKTVFREPRAGMRFKLAEDRVDFRRVDRTEQCFSRSREVIGDPGIEQTIGREDARRRRDQNPRDRQ